MVVIAVNSAGVESLQNAIINKGFVWEEDLLKHLEDKGLPERWWNPADQHSSTACQIITVRDVDVECQQMANCQCATAKRRNEFTVHTCVNGDERQWHKKYEEWSTQLLLCEGVPGDVIYQASFNMIYNKTFLQGYVDRRVIQ